MNTAWERPPEYDDPPELPPDPGTELIDALTGEVLGPPTVDTLIDAYERYSAAEQVAKNARLQITAALAARSPQTDGCRTTRVRGDRRRVKIEYPDDSWDQTKLKEAWHAYPGYRDEFLLITALRVKLREFQKMQREVGSVDYECFKALLRSACKGQTGAPRVVIEE
jgi:hypothetical protein